MPSRMWICVLVLSLFVQNTPCCAAEKTSAVPPIPAVPKVEKIKIAEDSKGQEVLLELVSIPSGSFQRGSKDGPVNDLQKVEVSAFLFGRFEVTQRQYEAVMGKEANQSANKGDDNPVDKVCWEDARKFCAKLEKTLGRTVRLPSEAEWEYACRAGTETRFYSGDSEEELAKVAWYSANSDHHTHPVGSKGEQSKNAFGLFDMIGNVWEWCEDDYYDNYVGAPKDGSAWVGKPRDGLRLLCGGCWYFNPSCCRTALRDGRAPLYSDDACGFRIVVGAPLPSK